MIKTMTAKTSEVDNVNLAIEQIKSQLGPTSGLLKNTIGIVACHYEFVYSGILKGICQALPFEIVGAISPGQSTADEHGAILLTLIVMTSDDVRFKKTLSPSLERDSGKVIAQTYSTAAGTEKPALLLLFAPFLPQNSGDEYVNVLSQVSGGVPCFGTIAVDDTLDFSNCFMLSDGEHYHDRMVMVLVYGDIHPRFFIVHVSKNKMLGKSAMVTKSSGQVLMELNNRPVEEYFAGLGLKKATETQYAMTSLPFLLDYNDGTPLVSRIFVMMSPEKHAVFAGAIPEGSTLHIVASSKDDVLLTAGEVVDDLLGNIQDSSGLLVYSCIGRCMLFGSEQFNEMEVVKKRIGTGLPFMMAFSGGEFCPTQVSDEKAINRFHNNAFVACLF